MSLQATVIKKINKKKQESKEGYFKPKHIQTKIFKTKTMVLLV